MYQLALLLVLLLASTSTIAGENIVEPELFSDCSTLRPGNGNATNITDALNTASSGTTLVLQNGCHVIRDFHLLQDLTDIRLIGSGGTVIIKCETDMGLAFVNVTRMQITNITVRECGLSGRGPHLRSAYDVASRSLDLFYNFTLGTRVGVFIADCSDLLMTNVTIQDTPGIGLVAINVMGTTEMNEVIFKKNVPPLCNLTYSISESNVGGGLYILYTDYLASQTGPSPTVKITGSSFISNYHCNLLTVATLYEQTSVSRTNYLFGSSGGLGITLAQLRFPVNVTITSTIFENNTAPFGAGAHVIQYQGVNNSLITFYQCTFQKNGFSLERVIRTRSLLPTIAGGLLIDLNLPFPSRAVSENILPSQLLPNTLQLTNCTFVENEAFLFAGMFIHSSYSTLTTQTNQNRVFLKLCRLLRNKSPAYAAFGAQSVVFSGNVPGVLIEFEDVTVEENDVLSFNLLTTVFGGAGTSAVATLSSVNLTIRGRTRFTNNNGLALLLVRSIINIAGDVSFTGNRRGGVMLLDFSNIVMKANSSLSFIMNTAARGGAIFVDLTGSGFDTAFINDCFLWFDTIDSLCRLSNDCLTIEQINATLVFEDNRAALGGTIFGSRLSTCPWVRNNTSGVHVLEQSSSVTFNPPPTNSSVVSTNPFALQIDNTTERILAHPGQAVNLSITAIDLFQQPVPAGIGAGVTSTMNRTLHARLGLSGFWFLPGQDPNPPVQAFFFGPPNNNLTVVVAGLNTYIQTQLAVRLVDCDFGFTYDKKTLTCICDPMLQGIVSAGVTCNSVTFALEVPPNFWLGESPVGGFIYERCIFDYCKVGTKTITNSNLNTQCQKSTNREGLMCAVCRPETSAVLGGRDCSQCSNAWIALILVFAVVGVALVLAISFLGFTISEGYLNSLLFYSNVTSFFATFFAPRNARIFFIEESINLSLGFEACFYDGMTTLGKVGLQLLFPAYLFLLMLIIIILARLSSRISNAGFSAVKTFATLLLLCYTSVGQTCIEILGPLNLSGRNGTYFGWYSDPTVRYGSGVHGFLVFVAVVLILFYILPFSISLLFPSLILRTKLSIMLKPLLDAFWNPFKPKLRFWLGLRAILRIIPFCFAVFVSYPTNCFLLSFFVIILIVLHVHFQPFEGLRQNALDEFFLFNLLLLSIGGVFFALIPDETAGRLAFVSILVILAYFAILVIIAFHIDIRFPIIRNKIKELLSRMKQKQQEEKKVQSLENDEPVISKVGASAEVTTTSTTTYSELREPILDYGEGEFSPL